MAKSFLSVLIGCAIDDGYIGSVEQPVTDFVPELGRNGFAPVKIKHLLQMTSGMDYTESDNPFGIHPRFYYGSNLEERLLRLKLKTAPGKKFVYKSGENQLLGLILSRALKPRTITAYMQERIWEPLGMEYGGLWSIDHQGDGLEKTFCCIAARARDYAKFGRLYLNHGNWNGRQIVARSWVEQSTRIDTTEGSAWDYQYQWWLVSRENGDYMAAGHLGQYVYVNPLKQLIIVRLGKSSGGLRSAGWKELFVSLSARVR
jgi:CubicO group peptidase (beta-lactamase class C family)